MSSLFRQLNSTELRGLQTFWADSSNRPRDGFFLDLGTKEYVPEVHLFCNLQVFFYLCEMLWIWGTNFSPQSKLGILSLEYYPRFKLLQYFTLVLGIDRCTLSSKLRTHPLAVNTGSARASLCSRQTEREEGGNLPCDHSQGLVRLMQPTNGWDD